MKNKIKHLHGGSNIIINFNNPSMLSLKIITDERTNDDIIVKQKIIDEILEKYNLHINPEEINILDIETNIDDNKIKYKTYKININNIYLDNKIKYSLTNDIISEIIKNINTKDLPALMKSLWTNKNNRRIITREMHRRNILEDSEIYEEKNYNPIFNNDELFNDIAYDNQNQPLVEIIKILLIKAIRYRNTRIVEIICRKHIDIALTVINEAIDECIRYGNVEILELLKKIYGEILFNDNFFINNMHKIIRSGNIDVIKYLSGYIIIDPKKYSDPRICISKYYKDALESGNPDVLTFINDTFINDIFKNNPFANTYEIGDDHWKFDPYVFLSNLNTSIESIEYGTTPFLKFDLRDRKKLIEKLPEMIRTVREINPNINMTNVAFRYFWNCGNLNVITKIMEIFPYFVPEVEEDDFSLALRSGDIYTVMFFIRKYKNIHGVVLDINYENLFYYACLYGNMKTIRYIINYHKKIFDDKDTIRICIRSAIAGNQKKIVKLLIDSFNDDERPDMLQKSLFNATINGHRNMFLYLFNKLNQHDINEASLGASRRELYIDNNDMILFIENFIKTL